MPNHQECRQSSPDALGRPPTGVHHARLQQLSQQEKLATRPISELDVSAWVRCTPRCVPGRVLPCRSQKTVAHSGCAVQRSWPLSRAAVHPAAHVRLFAAGTTAHLQKLVLNILHIALARSYVELPPNYPTLAAGSRTPRIAAVLNDKWVSTTSGSEDYSFKVGRPHGLQRE